MKTDSSRRLDLKPSLRSGCPMLSLWDQHRLLAESLCWSDIVMDHHFGKQCSEGTVCLPEHSKGLPSEQQARSKWGYISASHRHHVRKSSTQTWCSSSGSSLWWRQPLERQRAYRGAWNPQRQRQKGHRPYHPGGHGRSWSSVSLAHSTMPSTQEPRATCLSERMSADHNS